MASFVRKALALAVMALLDLPFSKLQAVDGFASSVMDNGSV